MRPVDILRTMVFTTCLGAVEDPKLWACLRPKLPVTVKRPLRGPRLEADHGSLRDASSSPNHLVMCYHRGEHAEYHGKAGWLWS